MQKITLNGIWQMRGAGYECEGTVPGYDGCVTLSTTEEMKNNFKAELYDNLRSIRHRASVALISDNNEVEEMYINYLEKYPHACKGKVSSKKPLLSARQKRLFSCERATKRCISGGKKDQK